MRVLITGGTGYLGTAMQERVPPGIEPIFAGHTRGSVRFDVTDEAALLQGVEELRIELRRLRSELGVPPTGQEPRHAYGRYAFDGPGVPPAQEDAAWLQPAGLEGPGAKAVPK